MSRRNKLQKFADLLTFPNVYENLTPDDPHIRNVLGERIDLKGKWNVLHFKNKKPITLELACGGGEYTVGLAQRFPERNFIGIDIKGARIWKGARIALREQLDNVAFIRMRIEQIEHFFVPGEIDEIWITFPDPFLKSTKANRRLTAVPFLDRYRKVLKQGAPIHLKTDSPELYEFTMEVLEKEAKSVHLQYKNEDIYAAPLPKEELEIKTHYERMHLKNGLTIKYVRFNLI